MYVCMCVLFWLCWVFVPARGLSLVCRLFISVASPVSAQALECGLCSNLWHTGSAAAWHVGSSRTRDHSRVPFTGRRIPNHWTTREVRANVSVSFATITHSSKGQWFSGANVLFLVHVTRGCPSGCRFLHGFSHSNSSICLDRLFLWPRQKQGATRTPGIDFKAPPPRRLVSHLFAFCLRQQVPWLVWTVELEVWSGCQDALQVKWQRLVVCSLLGDGDSGRHGLRWRSWQSAPCLCPCQGEVCLPSPLWFR